MGDKKKASAEAPANGTPPETPEPQAVHEGPVVPSEDFERVTKENHSLQERLDEANKRLAEAGVSAV